MEPFFGQIQAFGFNYAPVGWAACEGQIMSIQQNTALFSLLGTTYGGDGHTTFALPDFRAASARDNVHYCIATNGVYPPRD
jgi:microcystin-dependent protein